MSTTTKSPVPLTLDDVNQPRPVPVDIDAHHADLARRQRERDERCSLQERIRLCHPRYAAEVELRKPMYRWKVEFIVIETKKPDAVTTKDRYADDDTSDDDDELKVRDVVKTVEAQDEASAWGLICDKMGAWPSPRVAKPKFTKLKQINK
jgi:hypothetical protein